MGKGTFVIRPEDGEEVTGSYVTDDGGTPPEPPEPPEPGYEANKGVVTSEGKLSGLNMGTGANPKEFSLRCYVKLSDLADYPHPSPPSPPGDRTFRAFQDLYSRGRPSNKEFEDNWGISKMENMGASRFYRSVPKGQYVPPDKDIKECADRHAEYEWATVDIEHYPGYWWKGSDAEQLKWNQDCKVLMEKYIGYKPASQKTGMYGHPNFGKNPGQAECREYFTNPSHPAVLEWQRRNDNQLVCQPQTWDYNTDARYLDTKSITGNSWTSQADLWIQSNSAEAKRLVPGQPYFNFVTPTYKGRPDDPNRWSYYQKGEMEKILDAIWNDPNSDGYIVWGLFSWHHPPGETEWYTQWANASRQDWWREMVAFQERIGGRQRTWATGTTVDELLMHSDPSHAFTLKMVQNRTYLRAAFDPKVMHMDSIILHDFEVQDGSGWGELMISVDMDSGTAEMYVNRQNVLGTVEFKDNLDINWDAMINMTVGGNQGSEANSYHGAYQELWMTDKFLHWPEVWDRFSQDGNPLDLGEHGEKPLGEAPMIYLRGKANVDEIVNAGAVGQTFNRIGTISETEDTPSYAHEDETGGEGEVV